jgi:flavodoxin
MKMKGIVIYDTSSGNTKKIAETIAETLKESGMEVDLFNPGSKRQNGEEHNGSVSKGTVG